MDLQGFFIKEFEANGEEVTPSRVSFEKGFNAVVGQSDTGKSTLFKLIDFVLGKSSTKVDLPPQGDGFNTFYVEIHTYEEKVYTLMRKTGESSVIVKECALDEYEETAKSVTYAVSSGANVNLSDFLLTLSGVPNVYIKKSEKAKPIKLTYPQIRHIVFVNEDKTTAENNPSLFPDTNYQSITQYRHTLSYLMSGEDDRDFIPDEAPEVRKSRINGRIDYLNNEIDDLKKERQNLTGADDYISMSDKAFVDQYKASMNILSRTLDSLVEELQQKQDCLVKLNEEKSELSLFVVRLQQLKENYELELSRLEFINHGSTYLDALTTNRCPLCGTELDPSQGLDFEHSQYHAALQQEYAEIQFKIKDITNLISVKKSELVEMETQRAQSQTTIDSLNKRIENIKPDYDKLSLLIKRGEDNLSKKLRYEQLGELIERKEKECDIAKKQLSEVRGKKKGEKEETYVTEDFLKIVKDVLLSIQFVEEKDVIDFDTEANDITLGGRSRASYGKGNRSIITCAVNFALMDYCMQKERPFSRLLVYDSPLCTKYGKSSSDRATDNVLDAYAKYCNDKEWPYQVIIFDNKIDSDPENINKELYPNIHFVEFGTEERPGLFLAKIQTDPVNMNEDEGNV